MARSRRRKEPQAPPPQPARREPNPLGQLTPQLLGLFAGIAAVLFLLNYFVFDFELVAAILTALVVGSFAAMPWMGYQSNRRPPDSSD